MGAIDCHLKPALRRLGLSRKSLSGTLEAWEQHIILNLQVIDVNGIVIPNPDPTQNNLSVNFSLQSASRNLTTTQSPPGPLVSHQSLLIAWPRQADRTDDTIVTVSGSGVMLGKKADLQETTIQPGTFTLFYNQASGQFTVGGTGTATVTNATGL